jgi:hypothetical protein
MWSRSDKLTVGGLSLAAIAALAAVLVVPEFRQFFHLDKPQTAQAEAKPTQSVAPKTSPIQNTEPSKPQPSKPDTAKRKVKPTQKTATHVTGNNSVAGHNISGDNNVTGNNNQAAPTVNASNGIGIIGGTVTNPTVNNYINSAPPPRVLTKDERDSLASCLKTETGTFVIGALVNNGEAYGYALDFSEVFSEAGWKNEWAAPVASIMIGGGMWNGVHATLPALTYDASKQQAIFVDPSPETTAIKCLNQAKIVVGIVPQTDKQSGTIRIDVSDHP